MSVSPAPVTPTIDSGGDSWEMLQLPFPLPLDTIYRPGVLLFPSGLARNPHNDYDPSFPTFNNQMPEEREVVYGHLSHPFLDRERKYPRRP